MEEAVGCGQGVYVYLLAENSTLGPRFLRQVFYFLHNKAETLHALNLQQEICRSPIKAHPFRLGPLVIILTGARLAFTLVLNGREIKMW